MIETPVVRMFVRSMFATTTAFLSICLLTALGEEGDQRPLKLPPAANRQVSFVGDIQPILQRACIRCHGTEKQKGDYRLDIRDVAFTGGESYAPNIIAGNSAESPLIRFVSGIGDLTMPPEGNRLTSEEIGLLRAWIDQGAKWPDEVAGKSRDKNDLWSLKPLVRPKIPDVETTTGPLGSIDRFVLAKLAESQFSPSPSADRQTLIRRVYFDLIGLPPTPDDVEAFVSDSDSKAYERLIDRLLDSPRYGERWARHWLDGAHFAETHGNDQDRIREHAWPYRDYLIRAFNADKPYDRFIQEQIAADALFPDDSSLVTALGFLAAGPWDESSLRDIREDTLDRQIARYLDRDDMLATVMNNVTSMTVQCARCHDHKFDPITQRDYYSLQSVFSGVERANRKFDSDAEVHRQRIALMRRKKELEQRSPEAIASLLSADFQQQVADWERQRSASNLVWHVIDAESFTSSDGATLTKLADGSILSGGPRPESDIVTIVSKSLAAIIPVSNATGNPNPSNHSKTVDAKITAIRLEVLADDSLPMRGPGRQDNGNLHLSEFEVYADDRDKPETLVNPMSDFDQSDWDIAKAIDGNEPSAWGIYPKVGVSHRAIFQFKQPLQIGANSSQESNDASNDSVARSVSRLRVVLKQRHGRGHLIGRMRVSLTLAAPPFNFETLPELIEAILAVKAAQRSETQKLELASFQQLEMVNHQISLLPKPELVYAAAADFEPDGSLRPPPGPRPIHILHRGDIRNPREQVSPAALACVSGPTSPFQIPPDAHESLRRAALAKWLTDKQNPLTWRSIVNRVWHHHFGRGIVRTLNDFGHMGELPSHPELLDWLAIEFRDSGQSMKALHRLIMTSQTYRQTVRIATKNVGGAEASPVGTDPRLAKDADNTMLWRMNRTRLDAECIRDAILAFSDRLDLRMGGPSDRQFDLQPGIHVTPRVDYSKFDLDSDLGRRRSIYRFLFRTLPDPFMESLDCPSGDMITPARSNSVTVQQALALWNDAFIANECPKIAARVQRDALGGSPDGIDPAHVLKEQINRAVRLILCRLPTDGEIPGFVEYARKHGMANFCRLLLNSNEFLFVN